MTCCMKCWIYLETNILLYNANCYLCLFKDCCPRYCSIHELPVLPALGRRHRLDLGMVPAELGRNLNWVRIQGFS
jgi:hypothetical protein